MQEDKLEEMHDAVLQIKTVLLGYNGDVGLVGEFQACRKKIDKTSRNLNILIATLVGSGVLAGGISALFEAL